mmetsp:Transcript_107913/g.232442  ORF Transcript_107913/g.232442 Transcript_107913/m.232442 type:complete len:258 (-) Transcript_107913:258-1031(-)
MTYFRRTACSRASSPLRYLAMSTGTLEDLLGWNLLKASCTSQLTTWYTAASSASCPERAAGDAAAGDAAGDGAARSAASSAFRFWPARIAARAPSRASPRSSCVSEQDAPLCSSVSGSGWEKAWCCLARTRSIIICGILASLSIGCTWGITRRPAASLDAPSPSPSAAAGAAGGGSSASPASPEGVGIEACAAGMEARASRFSAACVSTTWVGLSSSTAESTTTVAVKLSSTSAAAVKPLSSASRTADSTSSAAPAA